MLGRGAPAAGATVPDCMRAASPPTTPDGIRDGAGKRPYLRFSEVTSSVYRNRNLESMFCYLSCYLCIPVPTLLFQKKCMSLLYVRLDIAVQYHSIRTQGGFTNREWNSYCMIPPELISVCSEKLMNCSSSPVYFGTFLGHVCCIVVAPSETSHLQCLVYRGGVRKASFSLGATMTYVLLDDSHVTILQCLILFFADAWARFLLSQPVLSVVRMYIVF